jgi:hypothetical protein
MTMGTAAAWRRVVSFALAVTACVSARVWVNAAPILKEPLTALWEEPVDLSSRNLFDGPWGAGRAPYPRATYTLTGLKTHGINPGVVVTDPSGREWHVKQHARNDAGAEGPVEVVLSRELSAVGYHQPPVYFMDSFTVTASDGTRGLPGGRFRLDDPSLHELASWSWQANPFTGTQPYRGLLVLLLLFNSTDLKDSNNTLYRVSRGGVSSHWYVVRDLGAALGETGRFAPRGNDATLFEQSPFILGVRKGYVEFANRSPYQHLFQHQITVDDVAWAGRLLTRLSPRQWREAFRAGGYTPDSAEQFLRKIQLNIDVACRCRTVVTPASSHHGGR